MKKCSCVHSYTAGGSILCDPSNKTGDARHPPFCWCRRLGSQSLPNAAGVGAGNVWRVAAQMTGFARQDKLAVSLAKHVQACPVTRTKKDCNFDTKLQSFLTKSAFVGINPLRG